MRKDRVIDELQLINSRPGNRMRITVIRRQDQRGCKMLSQRA